MKCFSGVALSRCGENLSANGTEPLSGTKKEKSMKRIATLFTFVTLLLLGLSFSFTTAQKKESIKRVEVTTKSIPPQAGKPYVIDLTRKGIAYGLAAGLDYSRVQVRTSKGEQALPELFGNRVMAGKLLVGLISDLRQLSLNLGNSGASHFNCDIPSLCSCAGDADCNDLFSSGHCGDLAVCKVTHGLEGTSCWCVKKL
jgi:hypothetical protein